MLKKIILLLFFVGVSIIFYVKQQERRILEPVNSIVEHVESQGDGMAKPPYVKAKRVREELLERKGSSYKKLKECLDIQKIAIKLRGIKDGEVINLDRICLPRGI